MYLQKQMSVARLTFRSDFEGPQEKLTLTTNAQPALLTTSFAILTALKSMILHQTLSQA